MDILWPGSLLLLGLIPLMVVIYIWMLRRRRRFAVRYSSLSLIRVALPRYSFLRRHLPFALFLLAITSLVAALARPVSIVQVPAGQVNVILAMDVSWSMCSIDIPPNRLEVAKDAAQRFIQQQPNGLQIGVVAFAGFAQLVQPPTSDQTALNDAIERLTTARRTAIGSAIIEALDAIAEINPDIPATGLTTNEPASPSLTPGRIYPEGIFAPDIIVLLTDGASNSGPLPLDAAQQAVQRGVRVYTIGYGTEHGGDMICGDWYRGGGVPGGGSNGSNPFSGGGFRRGIDELTLKQISAMTGGEYYSARNAGELEDVFRDLPTYLVTRPEAMEISVFFAAAGALLAALAIIISMLWNPLP